MIKLNSVSSFTIRHGAVIVREINAPFEMDRDNPQIIGMTILLDGRKVLVRNVMCIRPRFPIRKGEVIGLIVKEEKTP